MSVIEAAGPRVDWRRVGLFYGIALLGPVLSAVALLVMPAGLRAGLTGVFSTAAAMIFPLVAGLITERVARRRPLLTRDWARFKATKLRAIGAVVGWSALAYLLVFVAVLLVGWVTAAGHLPGAGVWRTQAEFDANLARVSPMSAGVSLPITAAIVATGVQAFVAGLTINGLFAFGEEYGWRGVLAEELRPLGVLRANLVTGVIWGLWHAPLIALGHNYGAAWAIGIPLFVVITIPLSFILWWARERSGWVAAPAVVHGAFNGFAGLLILLIAEADVLVAVPVGLWGAVALGLVALMLWTVPGLRPATRPMPATAGS